MARRADSIRRVFARAWESLKLVANGHDTKRESHGRRVDRQLLRDIDLRWHDLRHEAACRLRADGADIRTIQLMLGHASPQQTERYLNVTDEEMRKSLSDLWERGRKAKPAKRAARPSGPAPVKLARRRQVRDADGPHPADFGRDRLDAPKNVSQMSAEDRKHGAPGRTRTCDPRLRRPMLYPLSYGRVEAFLEGLCDF